MGIDMTSIRSYDARCLARPLIFASLLAASGVLAAMPAGIEAQQVLFTSLRDGTMQIYSMRGDGSSEQRLTRTSSSELQPVWSPDGQRVAYVSYRTGQGDIYVMNADGSSQTRLTDMPGLEQQPRWSPDGGRIAFMADRQGPVGIFVMAADGSGLRELTPADMDSADPAWSPDGKSIAFIRADGKNTRIMIVDLESGAIRPLAEVGKNQRNPVWSPDGKQVMYVVPGGRTEGVNIGLADVASGKVVALTNNPYINSQATFSPDGNRIVYLSNADSQGAAMNLHIINRDGTGVLNLTRSEVQDQAPVWSGDGSHIFFMSFRDWPGQIYRIKPDGSDRQRLTATQAQENYPVARPNARQQASVGQTQ
jgi:TolB protein